MVLVLKEVFQIAIPRLTANVESLEQLDITFHLCQLMFLLTCCLCRSTNKQFQPIAVDCVINGPCSLHKIFICECLELFLAYFLCLLNSIDCRWICNLFTVKASWSSIFSSNGLPSSSITLTSIRRLS